MILVVTAVSCMVAVAAYEAVAGLPLRRLLRRAYAVGTWTDGSSVSRSIIRGQPRTALTHHHRADLFCQSSRGWRLPLGRGRGSCQARQRPPRPPNGHISNNMLDASRRSSRPDSPDLQVKASRVNALVRACRLGTSMVRRGSTVRVRQEGLVPLRGAVRVSRTSSFGTAARLPPRPLLVQPNLRHAAEEAVKWRTPIQCLGRLAGHETPSARRARGARGR